MDIQGLELIETEESVRFAFKPATKTIGVKGAAAAVDRALERIANHREQVLELLRIRQGVPAEGEQEVEREIAVNVPSLAVQEANYYRWTMERGKYYQPSDEERRRMFSVLREGDLVIPDFSHSFTVRRPNGLLVRVDRKGRIDDPSVYTPALQGK